MDDLPPEQAPPIELEQCTSCGRKFNPDTLVRHKAICLKNKKKDGIRKPFDTAKQRAAGTELEAFNAQQKFGKSPADRVKMMAYERQAQKKKQWKRKHEDFISTIRSAREYDAATKAGVPAPPPEPLPTNPDYVQCPYCKRRFQENTAERHIPFCKEQNSRINRKNNDMGVSALNRRLKYRPPLLKARGGPPPADPYHPPGSHLISKKSNFSGTYTISEGSDLGHLSDVHERRVSKSKLMQQIGGMPAHTLPGNTPVLKKPHPPSKPAPFEIRSRIAHMRKPENSIPAPQSLQQRILPDGLGSGGTHSPRGKDSVRTMGNRDGGSLPANTGGRNNMRSLRSRDGGANMTSSPKSREEGTGVSSHSNSIRALRSREVGARNIRNHNSTHSNSTPRRNKDSVMENEASFHTTSTHTIRANSNHALRNQNIDVENGEIYPRDSFFEKRHVTQNGHATDFHSQGRKGSNSSTSASSARSPYHNAHGMTLSKFCYECGSGFPVPQAKYCCECGTKRI